MYAQSFSTVTLIALLAPGLHAATAAQSPLEELPPLAVEAQPMANPAPADTFARPISALRYEPRVDLQVRGFAEGQSDISIRGGTFDQTGLRLGATTIHDAQTGHYTAELPLDPMMLTTPGILTGSANAQAGFNSTAGTLAYGFAPITNRGAVTAGVGNDGLNFQQLYQGFVVPSPVADGVTLAVDGSVGRANTDGPIDYADSDAARGAGRLQLQGAGFQTDAYFGYEDKDYGWPGMYTGNPARQERDHTQIALTGLNHRLTYAEGSHVELGGYYRYVDDHYSIANVNYYAAHQFETAGYAIDGRHRLESFDVLYSLSRTYDNTRSSTALFNAQGQPRAGFDSRRYLKALLGAEKAFTLDDHNTLTATAGATVDTSNRDADTGSPLARVAWDHLNASGSRLQVYGDVSGATEVSGYTALNSAPAGRFGGNPNLGRTRSTAYELGSNYQVADLTLHAAGFYRFDNDLTDWTYSAATPNSRQANAVDLDTYGFETFGTWQIAEPLSLSLGYTWMDKDAAYANPGVDASYYALNYAEHRVTLAAVWTIIEGLDLRGDIEGRLQADNALRTSDDDATLVGLGLYWDLPWVTGLQLAALVDNLLDDEFQDFPGTPAAPRQWALQASYRW